MASVMHFLLMAVLAACALAKGLPDFEGEPLVTLSSGAVRGGLLTTREGRKVAAFKGVPYARPPVGKHRYKDPKPVKPWSGVWDANAYPSECLNFDRFPMSEVRGDEDCLYANVFTPRLSGEPLDVVVFVHGGGFMYGTSYIFGPEFILDRDVVLVHFNYRLGLLGFLSTEDEVLPGNLGLKDQAMVLQWIKENIAHFGGNPDSVTVVGLSAGGASVHYLSMSPLTKGLFHKAWAQSGSALNPWPRQEAAREKAMKLGELMGCSTASSKDLVECLRRRPARAIVAQVPRFQDVWEMPFSPFGPVVEPASSATPFLNQEPIDIMRAGKTHDVPFIWSFTSQEGLYPIAEFLGEQSDKEGRLVNLEKFWLKMAPTILDYNLTATDRDAVSTAAKRHYLGDRPIDSSTTKELIQMASDRLFSVGIEVAARVLAAVEKQPMYLYEFSFRPENSLSGYMARGDTQDWGVSHADDTLMLFDCPLSKTGLNAVERKVTNHLVSILTSFMRTGKPSLPAGSPAWDPLEPRSRDLNLLRFTRSGELEVAKVPHIAETEFWMAQPLEENISTLDNSSHDEF